MMKLSLVDPQHLRKEPDKRPLTTKEQLKLQQMDSHRLQSQRAAIVLSVAQPEPEQKSRRAVYDPCLYLDYDGPMLTRIQIAS